MPQIIPAAIAAISTALPVAGVSAGVATAISTVVLATIGFGIFSILKPSGSQGGSQTKWKADPYAGLPYAMGRTLVGGNIIYRRGHGKSNTFQTFVTVLCACGPVQSIDTFFANKTTVAFDAGGNAIGTYRDQIWQRTQLGTIGAAALVPPQDSPPGWTSAHKLTGYAASILTLKYDAKNKKGLSTEPAPGWIGHWVKVYDPRRDSSYPGGSGSCRALDEATYVWSENPHLHALTWTLGRWQNGKLVLGIGAPVSRIDVASFVEGANLDDARGWTIGGVVPSRPDTAWNSLKKMLQAGGATPTVNGGVISCINRAPRVSLATIGKGDIVGDMTLAGTKKRRTRINGVIPMYRSEAHDWEIVAADPISIADYVALDGGERTEEITYELVQDVDQVAQLAAYEIFDGREAGPGTVPLKPAWMNYRVGDCLTLDIEEGYSLKILITRRAFDAQSGTVNFTYETETDAKHGAALAVTGGVPPTVSITYNLEVDPPIAANWTLVGTELTSGPASIPALELSGTVDNDSAEAFVVDYRRVEVDELEDGRPALTEAGDYLYSESGENGWTTAGVYQPDTTAVTITSVAPNRFYVVGISYRVRGVASERLVLGPVQAGGLGVDRACHLIVGFDGTLPVTSDASTIYVAAFNALIDDGRKISFPAGSVGGLDSLTRYGVFWNLTTSSYEAEPVPALTRRASADYVFIRWYSTSDSFGNYPSDTPPPPGDGGDGPRSLGSV